MSDVPQLPASPATASDQDRSRPASAWARWLIRVRAYFRKEVSEIIRQPLLILSLIVGPLLVLMIFGASYQNSNPQVRTAIVLPPGGIPGLSEEQIRAIAGLNFDLRAVTEDRASSEAQLAAGDLDLIQVLPPNIFDAIERGESPQILFRSNAINPLIEGWVQYLAYAEVNEINKAILLQATAQAQVQAADMQLKVVDAEGKIAQLENEIAQADRAQLQQNLADLILALGALEELLPSAALLAAQAPELASLPETIARLKANLPQIERGLANGQVDELIDQIAQASADLRQLDGVLGIFINIKPDQLIAPVTQSYSNIRGSAYSAVIYYAPGVLALLIQHTAITLGALALVRERLMGAFEVFRVAPVSMTQLLIGKYLGYILFIACSSLVLVGALLLLGVPLLGAWWQFALLLLLLTIASLGVGFLISTLSSSDSQAIQLAMITLLMSIFFSGFFIALDSFARPALAVSYSIPMTHGVAGFQNLMLRGIPPAPLTWVGLAIIAIVTFVLVLVLTRRQFKKA